MKSVLLLSILACPVVFMSCSQCQIDETVQTAGCDDNITLLTAQQGLIRSTMYPLPTVSEACEQWEIAGFGSQIITLSFVDFDISPADDDCNVTYVVIGPEPCIILCGSRFPFAYISVLPRVTISYVYRESGAELRRGFVVKYFMDDGHASGRCLTGEFTCDNGKCLPQRWQCNTVDECGDASDERACATTLAAFLPPVDYACGEGNFGCVDSTTATYRCYHDVSKCDGVAQCADASDEHRCDIYSRPCRQWAHGVLGWLAAPCVGANCYSCSSVLNISSSTQPVQLRFRSFTLAADDYVELHDAPGTMDRLLGRYSATNRPPRIIEVHSRLIRVMFYSTVAGHSAIAFNLTYQPKGMCLSDQYRCTAENDCFEVTDQCDGLWDCRVDGSDEFSCYGCPGHYSCGRNSHQCYSKQQHCDGFNNCARITDELHCSYNVCGHQNGTYLCDSGQCIRENMLCDGVVDCNDSSDEVDCPLSTKVILSAVVGSLTCGLLLVIALGITYRLYIARVSHGRRSSRHISPITAIEQHIYAQRSAPPPYLEAMATSRSFDEFQRELLLQQPASDPPAFDDVVESLTSPSSVAIDNSDDELLDLAGDDVSAADDAGSEIVVALGCLARWQRYPKPADDVINDVTTDHRVEDVVSEVDSPTTSNQRANDTGDNDDDDDDDNAGDDDRPLLTHYVM